MQNIKLTPFNKLQNETKMQMKTEIPHFLHVIGVVFIFLKKKKTEEKISLKFHFLSFVSTLNKFAYILKTKKPKRTLKIITPASWMWKRFTSQKMFIFLEFNFLRVTVKYKYVL